MTSSSVEPLPEWGTAEHVPAAELARRQGVRPIESVDELGRPGAFESDEELDEFLADLYASRHIGLGVDGDTAAKTSARRVVTGQDGYVRVWNQNGR